MAKYAAIGEMRTRICVKKVVDGTDADGFNAQTFADLFPGKIWCKWVYQHGAEVFENMRLGLAETATLTMWYTPEITTRCKIWRENESGAEQAWDVVHVNVIMDERKLMEVAVRRRSKA